jgi:hypothetical protein
MMTGIYLSMCSFIHSVSILPRTQYYEVHSTLKPPIHAGSRSLSEAAQLPTQCSMCWSVERERERRVQCASASGRV